MDMNETRDLLERVGERFTFPDDMFERLESRRDRKRRNQRIAAGVVGIAVFVAALWAVTTGGSFNRTQQPAIQPTPTPPGTSRETDYLIDLNTGELTQLPYGIAGNAYGYAVSPDGTMVAYTSVVVTSGWPMSGTPQVFIANVDFTDVQQVTHDQRGAADPDWSPDGAAIAYTSGPSWLEDGDVTNIFVVDLATGETSQVTHEKPTTLGAAHPQFSPDGTSIVYVRAVPLPHPAHALVVKARVDMRIVPVTGGKSVQLLGGAPAKFSPDGSTLAVGCPDGLCIAHADGTNLRVLVRSRSVEPEWSPDGTRIAYLEYNRSTDGGIFVVDVATGETTFVAEGTHEPEWLDDHTLIIEPVAR
jgi:dipeptidyl aminopeptidase/acylaminoacyl peptidase